MRAAVRALLEGLVDYAGLFPPASLPMSDAVAACAAHRQSPAAWMLNRFVVPAGRLEELAEARTRGATGNAGEWPLSVLLAESWEQDLRHVETFERTAAASSRFHIDAVEAKAAAPEASEQVSRRAGAQRERWFEIAPGPRCGGLVQAVADAGGGVKLRTGGLAAAQFPSTEAVAHMLIATAMADVPFKATAGLHHALAGVRPLPAPGDAASGGGVPPDDGGTNACRMHGFLNVFLAALLARQLVRFGYPDPEAHAALVALLDQTGADAFEWADDHIRWRTHRLDLAEIEGGRKRVRSFGCCSFDDPVAEVRALRLA